ncbi:IPT/TIG domain-containing protein [Plantactinospora sp. S1510]|uniref:IPT/TIG domain-containing protein n=1 Tax=Plantactinospora alkalitolerans TaxID=2789879 RepID=A0ABS0H7C6_9ACTN|nr:IPT/TIG domain-containing protein [Plantactinospora alkalitolerans]MBF9134372.1 IPT/TIG domain-containing protein [Plantactinospora alkalitolerans]
MSTLATVLVAGGIVVGSPTPAMAQPGSADARGLVVDLSAEVLDVAVISADATVGSATAPAGGGTDTSTVAPISLPGAVGVTASGTVEEVTATRGATASSAFSNVNGLNLTVLGIDVIDAAEVTATATCPLVGAQTADTTITDLSLFGTTVTPVANGPSVTGSAGVTVPGLLGATLNAALTRTETTTATGATATAVLATLTLTGTIAGDSVTIPVGTVIVARASCERPPAPVPPTTATITPDSGPESGGQTVTITGTGFVPGETTVTFDGVPATGVTIATGGSSLTAVTPANPIGPAAVVVTTPGGSAAPLDYTYLADGSGATITGLTPPSGPTGGGTTVTITGTGLTGAVAVDFNGLPSTDFTINPAGTTITVVTPPNPSGPALVEVVLPAGRVTAPPFTYIAPTITSIVPNQGPSTGGTSVTITGTGFTGATGVTFGDAAGTNLVVDPSGTSLTVLTPAGTPGPVDVTVLIPGADAVAPGGFTYLADGSGAVVTGLTPTSGPTVGGTTVTITGTGLTGATGVTFDGNPGSNLVVDPSGTSLTVVTPPGLAGPAEVRVRVPGADAVAPDGFTYLPVAPIVESVDPPRGASTGGTTVTIGGGGFVPGQTTVTICGQTIPASRTSVNQEGTSLSFRTPPCPAGDTTVSVSTLNGVSNAVFFRYVGQNLPVTGSSTIALVGYSSGAVVIGVVLLLLGRRRGDHLRRFVRPSDGQVTAEATRCRW